jgi:HAD superfamily hydrolase (TIGR01509 family)
MPRRAAALLLDLDGTLVDSEPRHFLAHRAFLAGMGITIDERDHHPFIGVGDAAFYRHLMAARGVSGDAEAWVAAKTDELIRQYRADGLTLSRGGADLIAWLQSSGFPRMLVTGSERRLAAAAVEAAGVGHVIVSRVVREDTVATKPDPAPYLLAAARLGVPATSCLAVEDSLVGVRSAVAAGCITAGFSGLVPAADLVRAGAAYPISDLAALPELLARLHP